MPVYTLAALTDLATRALAGAGADAATARCTAAALVDAEAQGLASHGLSRVAQYATHLRNGRAERRAAPVVAKAKGSAILVDAGEGLAFPACAHAVAEGVGRSSEIGVGFAALTGGPNKRVPA
jgi:(2R)-3-sulfolactate dehydrogenase (NADP+)